MKTITEFSRKVREIENVWIPMSDGCRLAARIWLPDDAETSPVPAILEYIPYRKRDFTRARDEPMHHYFAGHGYAAVRVDIRGSGESDGFLLDEYLKQEQDDALEVIRWIASQPWCAGAVGMMGKSWGGFNALQVAARQPPELKAIVTVCSTDDRYADDVHYMGGCLLNDGLWWGSMFFAYNARPPDPALVGEKWREMWLERLGNAVFFPEVWLGHQRRDAYWKHGSVCEDFSQIACPVYAVGGWADGYSNVVFRLVAGLGVPCKGLIGPWSHLYAQDGVPGPAIGFLQETLRWWDHWLKGIETGIMDEPVLRVWLQDSVPPKSFYADRPGRWVAEASWPSRRITTKTYALNPGRLDEDSGTEARLDVRSPQTVGLGAGDWCAFGIPGEFPLDQRDEDGKSLTFDSAPLEERLEILGAPVANLDLAANRPAALVAVRLNDVAPDGASTRVTYGVLNLAHRSSHEHPEALEPGGRYTVRVQLNDIAHAFPAGHRIRIAISSSYWPIVWPSPEPVTLSVFAGVSSLELPTRAPQADDEALKPFEAPESAPPLAQTALRPGRTVRTIQRDAVTGVTVYTNSTDGGMFGVGGLYRIDGIALEYSHKIVRRFSISDEDPTSARTEIVHTIELGRDDWRTRIEARTLIFATKDTFRLQADLDAYEGETRAFCKSWDSTVLRDHM